MKLVVIWLCAQSIQPRLLATGADQVPFLRLKNIRHTPVSLQEALTSDRRWKDQDRSRGRGHLWWILVVSNYLFTVQPKEGTSKTAWSHFSSRKSLLLRTFQVAQLCESTLVLVRRGQNLDISKNTVKSGRSDWGVIGNVAFLLARTHSCTPCTRRQDRAVLRAQPKTS